MLTPVIDTSKEYGLVLEGGGAKGAYQIGAWKALKEAGVRSMLWQEQVSEH